MLLIKDITRRGREGGSIVVMNRDTEEMPGSDGSFRTNNDPVVECVKLRRHEPIPNLVY